MKMLLVCLAVLIVPAMSWGDVGDPGATQMRSEKREPRVDELKALGVVGENNQGYLEVRQTDSANAREIVESENRDRVRTYADQAKKTGSTVDEVGRQRAREQVESSPPKSWYQDEAGEWKQK